MFIISKNIMEIGDLVKDKSGLEGCVVTVRNIPWGFKYQVILTKGNGLWNKGEYVDFKEEEITLKVV